MNDINDIYENFDFAFNIKQSDIPTNFSKHNYLRFLLQMIHVPEDYNIPYDYKQSIEYCIENSNFITHAGRIVLKLYYFNEVGNLSMPEIAVKCNVTASRIRQILERTMRRMRSNKSCLYILFNGLKNYNDCLAFETIKRQMILGSVNEVQQLGNISISEIFPFDGNEDALRVRCYNCCLRAGIHTLYDLLTYQRIKIRNIGKTTEQYMYICVNKLLLDYFNITLEDYYNTVVKALPDYAFINQLIKYKED